MFEGRKLIIATQHQKEKVIAPPLEKQFKLKCNVPIMFDTDKWGTFTGEIERKEDAYQTVRQKCLAAMDHEGFDLGVASEGSFGPHPSFGFINADDELVILIDKKNNLEIVAREISITTNYNSREIKTIAELFEFAEQAKFPSHHLILKNSKTSSLEQTKGISNKEQLIRVFHQLKSSSETVIVETDMRAMCNPTRMSVIEKATLKLVNKLLSACPQCLIPGFDIVDAKSGLPCENCSFPTQSTLLHIYQCQHCQFILEKKFPYNKTKESAMYCDMCNP